jgi:hypothetical protein
VSKRSYRRLAVVTGAALAIGSMAPAMAARVVTVNSASANASADTVDINSITGGLLSSQATPDPLGLAFGLAGPVLTTVQAAPGMLLSDVSTIVGDALCIPTGVLGAALGADANAAAGLGIGLGGVSLGATGLLNLPLAVAGGVTDCVGPIVGDALGVVGQAQSLAGGVAGQATVLANTALSTATSLPQTVFTTAGGLLNPAGPLSSILNIQASGGASLLAGVGGIF